MMNKEKLFAPRLPEADVEVPGVGIVRVRGLSRAEAMEIQGTEGTSAIERKMLAFGMVNPTLTEGEVGQWQKASPASEIESVSNKIMELSGMLEGSAKEAVKEFHANPDATFPVHPGQGSGDDGGAAAGADV